MHILESYALQNDLKIDRPNVYEKYFPLAVDKFITLDSSCLQTGAMQYDHWNLVTEYLAPRLQKHGITILQLGSKNCQPIQGCYQATGQCDFNQQSYIIKRSLLHLSANNESSHVASSYGKKLVTLFPYNCYIGQFKPYWSEENDITLLQGKGQHDKPSFSPSENPKSINSIKPDEVAKAVLKKLNIYDENDPAWQYNILKIGSSLNRKRIDSNLSHVIDCSKLGVSSIILRMDLNHNEKNLVEQLKVSPCSIITSKAISESIIDTYSKKILEVVYYITDDHDPSFIKKLKSKSINFVLRSRRTENEINDVKIDYMDYGLIHATPPRSQKDFEELKDKDNLYYKSNYYIIHNGKFYPSTAALLRLTHGMETFEQKPQPIIDDPLFWEDIDHFQIMQKNS